MKNLFVTTVLFVALGALCVPAAAQGPKLQIDSLARLEDKASKVVDVSLDEKLMGMAARVLRKADPKDDDARKAADALSSIKEIYVRSYEFDTEGQYSPSDVEGIRAQVRGPGWSRLVGVRSKRAGENAEVYMLSEGDKILGLAIIAADPKQLTVVNIVGSIDIDRLTDLDGDFGIPHLEHERSKTPAN
jgi:hypothetical protein